MDKRELDALRHGLDTGVLISATPNVVKGLLATIDTLTTALAASQAEVAASMQTREKTVAFYEEKLRDAEQSIETINRLDGETMAHLQDKLNRAEQRIAWLEDEVKRRTEPW